MLSVKLLSSLDKIFVEGPSENIEITDLQGLLGETVSFQVAVKGTERCRLLVTSLTLPTIKVYEIGQIPSKMPAREDHDGNILKGLPGFYPDLLTPRCLPVESKGTIEQWHSFWLEVELSAEVSFGNHRLEVIVENRDLFESDIKETQSVTLDLEVIPVQLPPQKLIHTEWFHTDGIISYYDVPVFSEAYWQWVEKYLRMATDHGINMILTPVVTPPLDTKVGGERPTVQLVAIEKVAAVYHFDFTQLNRWSELCRKVGIEYLEMSHLYTQWGAKAAPKVMVTIEGQEQQLFGWETDAHGEEYREFLSQFIPALIQWLTTNRWLDHTYFHVSDEPTMNHRESYSKASRFLRSLIGELPVIDALSDYDFYEEGLVDIPIPANDHIDPFINHDVKPLWTYYCVSQNKLVSNRFFDMPSSRNRIIGYQLYKFGIQGFLHWGYNFYFTQFATRPVNPFLETDAGGVFPSGDAFIVYPGVEEVLPSIRLKVLREGLQDLRALELLESVSSKKAVLELLEEKIAPLTFSQYPRDSQWQIRSRCLINSKLKELLVD